MNPVNLSFAKIVATPTLTAWSQAYNAGNLFAVISLASKQEDEHTLTNLGKNVINSIEAEFFVLETKNLENIKTALKSGLTGIPEHISISLVLAHIKEQVLYVFVYGEGGIIMRRDNETGTLLSSEEADGDILSASGYLKQGDLVLLETKQFSDLIPTDEFTKSLELTLPNDIAEALTPHIHNAGDGRAAAIIISVTNLPAVKHSGAIDQEEPVEQPENEDELKREEIIPPSRKPWHTTIFGHLKKVKKINHRLKQIPLNKKQLVFILLITFLTVLLAVITVKTIQQRQQQQVQQKFQKVYSETENIYKDAMGIITLTPDRANELLKNADTMIGQRLSQFPDGSSQKQKLLTLQNKIRAELAPAQAGESVQPEAADGKQAPVLQALIQNPSALAITEDDDNVYLLNANDISVINKISQKKKVLIKNESDWDNGLALGTYLGNFYVLDKTKDVIKFIVAENGYGRTSYLKDNQADLSKTVSIAVDGSIWLLNSDGAIRKYTKGAQDTFTPKGLGLMSRPTQIYTSQEINNLYILDKGNSRIIKVSKSGQYLKSFQAEIISTAKMITISGDEKSAYILSKDKIWKISL